MMKKKVYICPNMHIVFIDSEEMCAGAGSTFGMTDENVDNFDRVREERLWEDDPYPEDSPYR